MENTVNNLFWFFKSTLELPFIEAYLLIFFAVLLLWVIFKNKNYSASKIQVAFLAISAMLLVTLPYWLFGHYSSVGFSDERAAGVPWLAYYVQVFGKGFLHEWAGGLDPVGAIIVANQYYSLERFLFTYLDHSVATFILKFTAVNLAFWGTKKLLEKATPNLTSESIFILSLLTTVSTIKIQGWVMCGNGFGYALLPFLLYFIGIESERRFHYFKILAISLFFTSSTTLFHQLPMNLFTLTLGYFLIENRVCFKKFVVGMIIFAFGSLINWLEVLNALVLLGPDTSRGIQSMEVDLPILELIANYLIKGNLNYIALPIGVVSILILAVKKSRWFLYCLFTWILCLSFGPLLSTIDWKFTGIRYLYAYRWYILGMSNFLVVILVGARALSETSQKPFVLKKMTFPKPLPVAFMSLFFVSAGGQMAHEFDRYQSFGSQERLLRQPLLLDRSWWPEYPFRIVTLTKNFGSSNSSLYGLDAFDGVSNNPPLLKDYYFNYAVKLPRILHENKSYHWLHVKNGLNKASEIADLNGLRIANVEYIFSDQNLQDEDLELIASDARDFAPKLVFDSLNQWYKKEFPINFDDQFHIYKVKNAWPRAFVTNSVSKSNFDSLEKDYYLELVENDLKLSAHLSKDVEIDLRNLSLGLNKSQVTEVQKTPDGYRVELKHSLDSQGTTLLVLNQVFTRFWSATSNGQSLELFPVNGVHMATVIDHSVTEVVFSYKRPSIL